MFEKTLYFLKGLSQDEVCETTPHPVAVVLVPYCSLIYMIDTFVFVLHYIQFILFDNLPQSCCVTSHLFCGVFFGPHPHPPSA